MNELQKNFVLASQEENLKREIGLEKILDVGDFQEPDEGMGLEYNMRRRVYGTRGGRLIRARLITSSSGEDFYVQEKIKMHPIMDAIAGALVIGAGFPAVMYGFDTLGTFLCQDIPDAGELYFFTPIGVAVGFAGAIKFFPSMIKDAVYETRIWKKYKGRYFNPSN